MDLSHPLFTLDPFAASARAEAKRLVEAGPVVPVDVDCVRAVPAIIRPRQEAVAGG